MIQLVVGAFLFIRSIAALWYFRAVDGQMKPIAQGGRDVWVALTITASFGFGVASFILGFGSLMGSQ